MADYPEYLDGPEPRRWAPWLWVLMLASLVTAAVRPDYRRGVGVAFFCLSGAVMAAQAVDGVRTGKLLGRFPNTWPVDATRCKEPITFWTLTVLYAFVGLIFMSGGVALALGLWR